MKHLGLWSPGLRNFLLKICKTLSPPPTYSVSAPLILEFLKAPFFVLHFSYYTLMTSLMILFVALWYYLLLFVILLPMLMICSLRCVWSGIWSVARTRIVLWTWIWSTRHLSGTGSGFLVLFDCSNKIGAIDVKLIGLLLRKNHLLRCWGWLPLLNWMRTLALSLLLKLPPRRL